MDKIFIGIDPGQSGAVAVIDEDLKILHLVDWPGDEVQAANTMAAIVGCYVKILDKHKMTWTYTVPILAALERVSSMPRQGVRSTFKFGTNYGMWKGILATLRIPFQEVTPQKWQKGVMSKAQDKSPSVAAAGRLFPTAVLFGPKGGKKDGRADALLIAYYCLKNMQTS